MEMDGFACGTTTAPQPVRSLSSGRSTMGASSLRGLPPIPGSIFAFWSHFDAIFVARCVKQKEGEKQPNQFTARRNFSVLGAWKARFGIEIVHTRVGFGSHLEAFSVLAATARRAGKRAFFCWLCGRELRCFFAAEFTVTHTRAFRSRFAFSRTQIDFSVFHYFSRSFSPDLRRVFRYFQLFFF